jgi:hypothetical protein
MSVKMTSMVFDRYPVGGHEYVLALCVADHAHDDGRKVFPTVESLARKSRQSVRATQMQLRRMEEDGWLQLVNAGDGGRGLAREYRINPDWVAGKDLPAHAARAAARVAEKPTEQKGAADAPFFGESEPVDNSSEKGAADAPIPSKGCISTQKRVHRDAPADNRKEPSVINPPKPPFARGADAGVRDANRGGGGVPRLLELKAWLAECKASGVKAIPDDDPVRAYAQSVGLGLDLLELCFREFIRRWSRSTKRRGDWRATFRDCVERNAYSLWYVEADGRFVLSNRGRQAQAAHAVAPAVAGEPMVWSDDPKAVQALGEALGVGRWDRAAWERGQGGIDWPSYHAKVRAAFDQAQEAAT